MEHLPKEVVRNILFRLPIKSIVCCRSVCKRWKSLLSGEPEFTISYDCSRSPGRCAYLLKRTNYLDERPFLFAFQHILALVQDDDQLEQAVKMRSPLPLIHTDHHIMLSSVLVQNDISHFLEVIGSIDSVFCLSYIIGDAQFVVLWNPATGDWHKAHHPRGGHLLSTGFAHGSGSGEYKVVQIADDHDWHHYCEGYCSIEMEAQVYDSRTDGWTNIPNALVPRDFDNTANRCDAIVKGVPYWSKNYSSSIISFDPCTDRFRNFERPNFGIEKSDITSWSLGKIEESLVMLAEKRDKSVDVWRMADGDTGQVVWSKIFSVGSVDGVDRWLSCWKNGEFLVSSEICGSYRKLKLYDYRSKRMRVLPDLHTPGCVYDDVFVFVQSLNSPRPPC